MNPNREWWGKTAPLEELISQVEELCKRPRYNKLRRRKGDVQIFVCTDSDRPYLAKFFGINLVEYFKKPRKRLEFQLKTKIFHHEMFLDDTIISKGISLDYGMYLEASLFGSHLIYTPDNDPWINEKEPLIRNKKDLEKLKYPDFYRSGVMPEIHKMYKEYKELVKDRLLIDFPAWYRGPWSVAQHLRGCQNLLLDICDNPNFVNKLMDFITQCRIKYTIDRHQFLNVKIRKNAPGLYVNGVEATISDLANDEVSSLTVSPEVYKKFIFPYEHILAEFYKGIHYYHSCGSLTPFLEKIKELPGLETLHVSPWTNLKTVRNVMGKDFTLQYCLHARRDIFEANESQMKATLRKILEDNQGGKLQIVADSFGKGPVVKIKKWLDIAREIVT